MTNYLNDKRFIDALRVLYDYMQLDQKLEPCDVIIGCGCKYLDIPIKCAELYKDGRSYDIAGKGSYRGDLKAGMTLSFSDNSFEAHIWVVNEDGNKLAENYMRIIPLEIILLK